MTTTTRYAVRTERRWTVRLHTEGRHYSWVFSPMAGEELEECEARARRTLLAAKAYLETIGEPLTGARIIPSVRYRVV
jgi:hypothetical protein